MLGLVIEAEASLPHELQWNGAWRRLEREERAGMITGVHVGVARDAEPTAAPADKPRAGSAVLDGGGGGMRVDVDKLEPAPDPVTRPNGRVRMPR